MMIDTHSHLHGPEFDADRGDVLRRSADAGVARIVLPGVDIADSRRALEVAAADPVFRVAVGVHPHAAGQWDADAGRILREELVPAPGVVAIGEIGLDYHYDFAPVPRQHEAFLAQLAIAHGAGLPVVIHCREAYDDMTGVLRDFCAHAAAAQRPRGVMHCYFGTLAQAEEFLALGFVLGIGGAVTFKKAEELHDVVRRVPLESMVLETDAPYMSPVPHRGRRNEPAYLPLVAARIAELKGVAVDEVVRVTAATALSLFRMGADPVPVSD